MKPIIKLPVHTLKHFRFLPLLFAFFVVFRSYSQDSNLPQKTIVVVSLNGLDRLTLNCINIVDEVFTQDLMFLNPGKKKTEVVKTFFLSRPTILWCSNIVVNRDGRMTKYFRTILLIPGDSMVLKNTDTVPVIVYSGNYKGDLGRLIKIPRDPDFKSRLSTYTGGLDFSDGKFGEKLINRIREAYADNNRLITDELLKGTIDSVYARYLRYYNYNLKCNQIADITFNPSNFKQLFIGKKLLDSCYQEIEQNYELTQRISTESPLFSLIRFNAYMRNSLTDDFWDYFHLVAKKIFESSYYKRQMYYAICSYANNPENDTSVLREIIRKAKSNGLTDVPFDSIYAAMAQMHRVTLDENSEKSSLMVNAGGDTLNFFSVLKSLRGKVVLVDFWASWCIPCRGQMPYLKKVKEKYSSGDVGFISVSIDEDNHHETWLKANKDEQLHLEKHTYRLIKGNKSRLLQIYNVESVPRYILYDRSGGIASLSFTTPDDKKFHANLTSVIQKE